MKKRKYDVQLVETPLSMYPYRIMVKTTKTKTWVEHYKYDNLPSAEFVYDFITKNDDLFKILKSTVKR